MAGSPVQVVFVDGTSPLMVRETADSTPVPARLARMTSPDAESAGHSFVPSVGDAVLAVFARGTYYVLGGA